MKKVLAAAFLATLTTTALAANWVTDLGTQGVGVGVNLDTFDVRRAPGGEMVLIAEVKLSNENVVRYHGVTVTDCRNGYGSVYYFINDTRDDWHFEFRGDALGDFIARTICNEGKRRGAY